VHMSRSDRLFLSIGGIDGTQVKDGGRMSSVIQPYVS